MTTASPRFTLDLIAGGKIVTSLRLEKAVVRVGAAKGCDLVLQSPVVAPIELEIHHKPDGRYEAVSKARTNVLLNGKPLTSACPIVDGDRIAMHWFVLEFRLPSSLQGFEEQSTMGGGATIVRMGQDKSEFTVETMPGSDLHPDDRTDVESRFRHAAQGSRAPSRFEEAGTVESELPIEDATIIDGAARPLAIFPAAALATLASTRAAPLGFADTVQGPGRLPSALSVASGPAQVSRAALPGVSPVTTAPAAAATTGPGRTTPQPPKATVPPARAAQPTARNTLPPIGPGAAIPLKPPPGGRLAAMTPIRIFTGGVVIACLLLGVMTFLPPSGSAPAVQTGIEPVMAAPPLASAAGCPSPKVCLERGAVALERARARFKERELAPESLALAVRFSGQAAVLFKRGEAPQDRVKTAEALHEQAGQELERSVRRLRLAVHAALSEGAFDRAQENIAALGEMLPRELLLEMPSAVRSDLEWVQRQKPRIDEGLRR